MRHSRLTENERNLIYEEINEIKSRKLLNKRKKRLYNRFYRKSPFFISMWSIRLFYIIMFFYLVFSESISSGFREEIVSDSKTENYTIRSNNRRWNSSYEETSLKFITNKNNYTSYFRNTSAPFIQKNDTILIERDIFNKPIFFTKREWDMKYKINSYFDDIILYINILLVIITLISFAFNDGLYKYNNMVLKFISINILISSIIYLSIKLYYFFLG